MADNTTDTGTNTVPPTPLPGRRRFLGAGVGATPAFLVLASQPALGTTCFTPSRSLSRNMSVSQTGRFGTCSGRNPAWYLVTSGGQLSNWPTGKPGAPGHDATFHSIFAGSQFNRQRRRPPAASGDMRQMTLREVLNLTNCPSDLESVPTEPTLVAMARRTVAAYLNVVHGFVPPQVADLNRIIQIWAAYTLNGNYTVTAGQTWTPTQILEYYQSNMIAPA